jgi:RNA recognition motif-containing protein
MSGGKAANATNRFLPNPFAFVTMSSHEEAQKAIDALNGATIDGRNLTVTEARPRQKRTGKHAACGRRY